MEFKQIKRFGTSDSYDAVQQLAEIREDGRAGVGLHSAEVPSRVQIPDSEGVVEPADD